MSGVLVWSRIKKKNPVALGSTNTPNMAPYHTVSLAEGSWKKQPQKQGQLSALSSLTWDMVINQFRDLPPLNIGQKTRMPGGLVLFPDAKKNPSKDLLGPPVHLPPNHALFATVTLLHNCL